MNSLILHQFLERAPKQILKGHPTCALTNTSDGLIPWLQDTGLTMVQPQLRLGDLSCGSLFSVTPCKAENGGEISCLHLRGGKTTVKPTLIQRIQDQTL